MYVQSIKSKFLFLLYHAKMVQIYQGFCKHQETTISFLNLHTYTEKPKEEINNEGKKGNGAYKQGKKIKQRNRKRNHLIMKSQCCPVNGKQKYCTKSQECLKIKYCLHFTH